MQMKFLIVVVLITSFLMLSSCTWVKLTAEGENVAVLVASEVADCTRTGTTTVEVLDRAVIDRDSDKVAVELRTLAINLAADRGKVIVPSTGVTNGEQTFIIYRCINL